jgi:hypothetical protein
LFWFSLEGGCGGSKKVVFFSLAWVGHMDRTLELEINFCFGLVCKVVVKVWRCFMLFTYMGAAPYVQKIKGSCFLTTFWKPFSWVHCFAFMSFCSSLFYYCFFFFFVLWRDERVPCLA